MSARRVLSAKKQQVYLQFDEVRLRITGMSNSKLSRDYFEFSKKKSFQFFNLFEIDSNKHCSDFFTFELLFNYFKLPVL